MMTPAALRLAALIICASSAIPADAKPWQQMAPQWFDQTIYQPDCSPGELHLRLPIRLLVPACLHPVTTR
jgi:hypothetical protein